MVAGPPFFKGRCLKDRGIFFNHKINYYLIYVISILSLSLRVGTPMWQSQTRLLPANARFLQAGPSNFRVQKLFAETNELCVFILSNPNLLWVKIPLDPPLKKGETKNRIALHFLKKSPNGFGWENLLLVQNFVRGLSRNKTYV